MAWERARSVTSFTRKGPSRGECFVAMWGAQPTPPATQMLTPFSPTDQAISILSRSFSFFATANCRWVGSTPHAPLVRLGHAIGESGIPLRRSFCVELDARSPVGLAQDGN